MLFSDWCFSCMKLLHDFLHEVYTHLMRSPARWWHNRVSVLPNSPDLISWPMSTSLTHLYCSPVRQTDILKGKVHPNKNSSIFWQTSQYMTYMKQQLMSSMQNTHKMHTFRFNSAIWTHCDLFSKIRYMEKSMWVFCIFCVPEKKVSHVWNYMRVS